VYLLKHSIAGNVT